MKKVLYRPSWQKLRVSCLAQNHPNGGFNTLEGTTDNLARLNNYIQDTMGSDINAAPQYVQEECARMRFSLQEERACRIWRVLNLLNATRMGYSGQGKRGSEMDRAVEAYRNVVQQWYDGSTVVRVEPKWDWDVVQWELETMWREERYWFTKIWDDLSRRGKVAAKRRVGQSIGIDKTRPELLKFLGIMETINRHPV